MSGEGGNRTRVRAEWWSKELEFEKLTDEGGRLREFSGIPQSIDIFSTKDDLPARRSFAHFPMILSLSTAKRLSPLPARAIPSTTSVDTSCPMPRANTRRGALVLEMATALETAAIVS
jgi:hypothetical protein